MLFWFNLLLLLLLPGAPLLAQNLPATTPPKSSSFLPLWQPQPPHLTDLVLIYQGGLQRPHWTTNQFAPYVTYRDPQTTKEQWLFDAFLFIEFQDGRGHTYEPGRRLSPAQQADWLWLLNRNFSSEDGIPQLEQLCCDTTTRLGPPLRPRQVLITIPEPILNQTNWGTVDGRTLDFHLTADRVTACRWYVESALAKWQALAPQHLQLAGFYWLHESAPRSPDFLSAVAQVVHEHHQQFFWIPYWQGNGPANWRACGFDAAWQQPNHFFHPEVPDSRLTAACTFAREHGLGLEMEFDSRLLSRPEVFAPRFNAYLDAFTASGARTNASLAWYEGGGTLFNLATSQKPDQRRYYERVARFVHERQQLADQQVTQAK